LRGLARHEQGLAGFEPSAVRNGRERLEVCLEQLREERATGEDLSCGERHVTKLTGGGLATTSS